MIPGDRIQQMADRLTEAEYAYYRDRFISMAKEIDAEGVTLLKHLKKIPKLGSTDDFVYEYEMSDSVMSFFIFMEREFKGKDQDLRLAITVRVLNEVIANPMFKL